MIAFLQEIIEAKKSLPGPIVVHCRYTTKCVNAWYFTYHVSLHSDGLGRSGALIATDIARQQLENEKQVHVVDIVTTMREDRGGMISTNK